MILNKGEPVNKVASKMEMCKVMHHCNRMLKYNT
jgi:hypothetical protein